MSISVIDKKRAVTAWTRLVRIHQRIEASSDRGFRDQGLSTAWFDVLARVGARDGLTQDELAATLLVTKGNVSQLVSKMEAAGLVERRADGRRQRLSLTAAGTELRQRAVPRQEALLADSLSALSPDEQDQLIRLLRKWERS